MVKREPGHPYFNVTHSSLLPLLLSVPFSFPFSFLSFPLPFFILSSCKSIPSFTFSLSPPLLPTADATGATHCTPPPMSHAIANAAAAASRCCRSCTLLLPLQLYRLLLPLSSQLPCRPLSFSRGCSSLHSGQHRQRCPIERSKRVGDWREEDRVGGRQRETWGNHAGRRRKQQ